MINGEGEIIFSGMAKILDLQMLFSPDEYDLGAWSWAGSGIRVGLWTLSSPSMQTENSLEYMGSQINSKTDNQSIYPRDRG